MVSNALVKSKAKTWTYGLVVNRFETVSNKEISAHVVEPVGLKANWVKSSGAMDGDWSSG